ncbi:MAG: ankyrin repeat domain-containing protein [Planctomycetes bacterium]|nr:ankyrin repeat domain-containing protein [Planctomycetota bacterium]
MTRRIPVVLLLGWCVMNCQCGRQESEMLHAAKAGDIAAVKRLINAGADIGQKDEYGWTALHILTAKGAMDGVAFLVEKGADVTAKDNHGYTPLHIAAKYHQPKAAELFLSKGADVNARDAEGETPLAHAMFNNAKDVAEVLRRHGGKTKKELNSAGQPGQKAP